MNHPNSETCAAYLSGGLPESEYAEISDHLKSCPECAARLDRWERVIDRLNQWELPRRSMRRRFTSLSFKWAAAAVVVLGLTFGFGRSSVPEALDLDAVRAKLEPSLKVALFSELEQRIRQEWVDGLAKQISASTEDANARLRNDLLQTLQVSREEDRKAILALVERLNTDIAANYLSLRKDLETVASLADNQIQQARLGLIRLAATARAESDL